jgi:hypothetical protein
MFNRQRAKGLAFATERGVIEDVPFQVGLVSRGKLGVAGAEILALYRIHPSNASGRAAYFSGGLRLLRQIDRMAAFRDLNQSDRTDMLAWFAFIGRAAAVTELGERHRARALRIYCRELIHQLRDGHFKFVAAFPPLALGPRWLFDAWRYRDHPKAST